MSKIGFKIREHTLKRVPYTLVCGDQEMEVVKSGDTPKKARISVNSKLKILISYLHADRLQKR